MHSEPVLAPSVPSLTHRFWYVGFLRSSYSQNLHIQRIGVLSSVAPDRIDIVPLVPLLQRQQNERPRGSGLNASISEVKTNNRSLSK